MNARAVERSLRVLAVDDQPGSLRPIRDLLEASGQFEVAEATSLAEALERSATQPFDAVVLDLGLPDSAGLDTFHRFQAQAARSDLPVVVVTGLDDDDLALEAVRAGAQDYLVKGRFDPGSLDRVVRHAIERKRSAVALRTSEARLARAQRIARLGHWEWDAKRERLEWSDEIWAIFGLPRDTQLTFEGIVARIHPEDRARNQAFVDGLLAGSDRGELDFRVLKPDGSVAHVRQYAEVNRDQDGAPRSIVGTMQDITDRVRAQVERENLRAGLVQSDRLASMGMLAAGVAHELNNPLAYVLYNLESLAGDHQRHLRQLAAARDALLESLGEEAARRALGAGFEVLDPALVDDMADRLRGALEGTRRIKAIAKVLGTFSRIEPDTVAPIDLRAAIESAVDIASNEIKYRARVITDFGATSSVMASDGQMSQVFLNLLVSAAHSIDEGHVERNEIRVRTWQEGGEVCAEVRDTGCGISSESLGHVFDPYSTSQAVGAGSGLGLSIARNIVTSFGGTIGVASEVGHGTSFVIRLPAASSATAAGPAAASGQVPPERRRGRILVIDDEAGIRKILCRILKNHELVEADSGGRGLEILAEDQGFDVVICDLMMPRVSGVDVHRWLAREHPALAAKVVFVTGGAFTPNAREYLKTVDNPRVEKPFDAAALAAMVDERVAASKALVTP
jgi:PAS domain S-box-containing protein